MPSTIQFTPDTESESEAKPPINFTPDSAAKIDFKADAPKAVPFAPKSNPRPLAGRLADIASRVIGGPEDFGLAGFAKFASNPLLGMAKASGVSPEQMRTPLVKIAQSSTPKGEGILPETAAGISDFVGGLMEALSTPETIMTLGVGGLGEKAAQVVSAKFLSDMAVNAPEQAAEVGKKLGEGDKAGATTALLNYALATVAPAAALHPAVAPVISKMPLAREEAAKSGVTDASKEPGPTGVPVPALRQGMGAQTPLRQQGQAAKAGEEAKTPAPPLKQGELGVQTPPAAKTVLKPEHQAALDEAVKESDVPIEYHEPTDPNEPFAGQIAQPDRTKGTIRINPKELSAWLDTEVPKGKEAEAIRSLLSEERIHLGVSDEQALGYHDTLTAAEKGLGRLIYGKGGAELSPTMLGHEMLRMRMQQLARMTVRETLQRSLSERWSVKSMLALNDAIRGIRETLSTSASKQGLAILDRVSDNLKAALSKNVPPGAIQEPSAQRRKPDKTEEFFLPPVGRTGDRVSASESGALPIRPASITTDDIDWKSPDAFKPIDPELLDKPYSLGRYLTKGGRVAEAKKTDRISPKTGKPIYETENATLTKSVVALEKDGKVDVVHIYQDPDDLARAQRPTAIGQRVHSSIRDILADGYKPIAGYLLKSPAEKFKQHFDSVDAFQKQFGEPAETQALKKTRSYEPPPQVQEAQVVRPLEYATEGGYEPGTFEGRLGAVTDAEAAAVVDHVAAQHEFSPAGVRAALDSLRTNPNRQALSAFRKLAARLQVKYPNLSSEQLVDKLANQIYETHRDAASYEDFIGRTVAQGPARRGEAPLAKPKPATEAATGARELAAGERTSPIEHAPTIPFVESIPRTKTGEVDLEAIRKRGAENYPLTLMRQEGAPSYRPARSTGRMEEYGSPEPMEGTRNLAVMSPKDIEKAGGYKIEPGGAKAPSFAPREAGPTLEELRRQGRGESPSLRLEPGAQRRQIENQYDTLRKALVGAFKRHSVRQQIAAILDGSRQLAQADTAQAGEHIRIASSKALPEGISAFSKRRLFQRNKAEAKRNREAAMFYVASGKTDALGSWTADKGKLDKFQKQLDNAEARAKAWANTGTLPQRWIAPKYKKAVARYKEALQWARDHWGDKAFVNGAEAYRQEMANHIQYLNAHGISVEERENYVPGLYEGDFWADGLIDVVTAPRRLLGEQFRASKKFANPIDAIEGTINKKTGAAAPYWLASLDVADLAEHRILQGHRMAERAAALDVLRMLTDPVSKEPVAKAVIYVEKEVTDPFTGETHKETVPTSPDPYYELVQPRGMRSPLAIRRPFSHVIESVLGKSAVPDFEIMNVPIGQMAMSLHTILKHGVMTLIDTFHPSRIGQLALATMGYDAGYKGGYVATHYRPEDLDAAVAAGYVPKKAADWARATVQVQTKRGPVAMTRMQIGRDLLAAGLNASRNADALYKDAVRSIPIIGEGYHKLMNGYNTWLFDRFIPGLMQEAAIRNLEKMNAADPKIPYPKLVADVAKDANFYFANMGRQGLLRNATLRNMAQMTFFAPSWFEGLLQKEMRFASRISGLSRLTGARSGLPPLGMLGGAVGRGLVAYLVGAQLINLTTRKKFTWQNPEEHHKWDAFIPIGDHGLWLSPFSVFGEVMDEFVRLAETKPTIWNAIGQLGENRLGPLGRAEQIIRTGESPQGQKYTSTMGELGGVAAAVTPFAGVSPLSLGSPIREAAHKLFPNQVLPNAPGKLPRQAAATLFGVKTIVGETAGIAISRKADEFMAKNHLKKETGWQEVQTDEPSYTKLRSALRIGDAKEAASQFKSIREDHTDKQIYHAMKLWKDRPFTGNAKSERQFLHSLDNQGLDEYWKARAERQQIYRHWLDLVWSQPSQAQAQ